MFTGIVEEAGQVEQIRAAKRSLGLKDDPVVGTIGRLSSVKGQRFFIEAMKYVKAVHSDAQGILLGTGEEEEALKGLLTGGGRILTR